jgi:hypothetical protein
MIDVPTGLKKNTIEDQPEWVQQLDDYFRSNPSSGNNVQQIFESTPPFNFKYRGRKPPPLEKKHGQE